MGVRSTNAIGRTTNPPLTTLCVRSRGVQRSVRPFGVAKCGKFRTKTVPLRNVLSLRIFHLAEKNDFIGAGKPSGFEPQDKLAALDNLSGAI